MTQSRLMVMVLFIVQELLLFSLFVTLIYGQIYGTYIPRIPLSDRELFGETTSLEDTDNQKEPEHQVTKEEDICDKFIKYFIKDFIKDVDCLYQYTFSIVLYCIGIIFTSNIFFLLRKLNCKKNWYWIIVLVVIALVLFICLAAKSPRIIYVEDV